MTNLGDNLRRPFWVLFIAFLTRCAFTSSSSSDEFHEELLLRPLPSGHLHAHFQFVTTWHVPVHNEKGEFDSSHFRHYHLFPKALGEIVAKHRVQELRLSQTMGLWKTQEWGYPVTPAPPGMELWTWFHPSVAASSSSSSSVTGSDGGVDATWKRLVDALSGLSCSSLTFISKDKLTVSPTLSFKPTGAVLNQRGNKNSSLLRYGVLPREIVCTENLTPWKKLLPCDSKAGLATLFNDAKKLYDTAYHSLVIHLRPVCRDAGCTATSLELVQSLSVVFDPVIQHISSEWSMRSLFGKLVTTRCALATSSKVMVETTSNATRVNKDGAKHLVKLTPEPNSIEHVTRGGVKRDLAVWDMHKNDIINVNVRISKKKTKETVDHGPDLHARRHVTGSGQHLGGVATIVENAGDRDTMVVLMETVPWFLRTFYHTIALTIISKESHATSVSLSPHYLSYFPSKDNERSTLMEIAFTIPAKSAVKISYEFERAFLKWTAYPPDANHGFYVASGVITAVLLNGGQVPSPSVTSSSSLSSLFTDNSKSFPVRIYTDPLLVTMPTPDFSMPYNVICLVSTAVAIAFGTVHNQATRRFLRVHVKNEKGGALYETVGLGKLKRLFQRLFRRKPQLDAKETPPPPADGKKATDEMKDKVRDDNKEAVSDNKEAVSDNNDGDNEGGGDKDKPSNGSCLASGQTTAESDK